MTYVSRKIKFKSIVNYKVDKIKHHQRIVKTPFEVKTEYDDSPAIDYNIFSPDVAVVNFREFLKLSHNCGASTLNLLIDICYMIEPNTNLIKASAEIYASLYSKTATNIRSYAYALSNLCTMGFLARTSRRGVYIINHNIFYKGDINKFAKEYMMYYGVWEEPARNEAGNVIIDKQNIMHYEYKRDSAKYKDTINKIQQIKLDKYQFINKI